MLARPPLREHLSAACTALFAVLLAGALRLLHVAPLLIGASLAHSPVTRLLWIAAGWATALLILASIARLASTLLASGEDLDREWR